MQQGPPKHPGQIQSQPRAAVNTADKLFAQLIGKIAVTVAAIATLIEDNS